MEFLCVILHTMWSGKSMQSIVMSLLIVVMMGRVLGLGSGRVGWCYVSVCCESRLFV